MNYEFPTIRDITDIERHREAGLIHKTFGRWSRGNGTIVYDYTYMTDDVFPPVGASPFAALARELRGITFDAASGRLLSRPFHKFFNAGERTETLEDNLRFGEPHVVLEKLDGSMVHAFLAPDGALAFATRSGVTDISNAAFDWYIGEDASGAGRAAIERVCRDGYTPVFEWASPGNIVVVEHAEPSLTLTAVRHRESGRYLDLAELARHAREMRVPHVRSFDPVADWRAFSRAAYDETEGEGYVVRFGDGHMIKVKNARYARIHRVKSRLVQEKDVAELTVGDGLDDVLPHLTAEERRLIGTYRAAMAAAIDRVAGMVERALDEAGEKLRDEPDRERQKRFWLEYAAPLGSSLSAIAMQAWTRRADVRGGVRELVLKHTTSGPKFERLAEEFDLPRWRYRFAGDL